MEDMKMNGYKILRIALTLILATLILLLVSYSMYTCEKVSV